mmetsp:Transcript_9340/g.13895  ORF Transcript_9340/g.13895 Transcript_9340/m.13895 type:complete len:514 (+) Transcript_9340:115-1656(+)|eukprot:CAMPEP_0203675026 /NCGR_PEP_ID=MMETSP0090-20130426/18431_1 /ASSEMBLY_ACC=CAM_ASM_001088 /TAXON_ID=426623 /ORGANISM="Chaetoceros affinis, Strain CCMP159" /LENGTH=513 /DNA_ID=CAMNT_0050541073 /DNA_START=87 /DNA_END=1628 /DNA_ORIENTATION=-
MSATNKEQQRSDEHNRKNNSNDQEKTTKSTSKVIENTDCAIFLRKTYHMIDTCDQAVAGWSDDGTSFLVKNVQLLASNFLPQYFKHNQFSSFVRQLNFYGFRKEKNESVRVINNNNADDRRWHFRHEHFVRGRPELLSNITRRIPNKGATRGAATGSSQRKNDVNNNKKELRGVEASEKEKKECQSLKSEIASLQDKLHLMENNIDQLSKTLHLKLNINTDSGQNMKSDSNKVQSKADNTINSQYNHNKSIDSNKRLKTKAVTNKVNMTESSIKKIQVPSVTKSSTTALSNTKPSRAPESSHHVASSDLPDLSMATDEDLLMEDVSASLSRSDENRNDSSASLISSCENLSSCTIVEVDEMLASIENDLKTSMTEPAKDDMGVDDQLLPAFVPSFEKQCEQRTHQQDNRGLALKKIKKVDCLLHDLKAIEKEEFVNKILTEMSTVFGKMALDSNTIDLPEIQKLHEKGIFQANDLIAALERILTHQDTDKKLSPNLFTPEEEDKKSSFVKIEV